MKKTSPPLPFKIDRRLTDKRLDSALVELLEQTYGGEAFVSRSRLTALVKEGVITVNGRPVKTSYRVHLGDLVEVPEAVFGHKDRSALPAPPVPLPPVIYENEAFLVLNKPAGLVVHPTPSSQIVTLVPALLAHYPELVGVGEDPLRPGLVHRLDAETSGVLLVAKTQAAYEKLKQLFQERRVKKTYLALVSGHLANPRGRIDTPLTRFSGSFKRSLVRKPLAIGKTWSASTLYRVLCRYRDYDLVEVKPETGRTHQIRVHLSGLGHPVVGDKLYGYRAERRTPGSPRHLLHAARLEFSFAGEGYAFEAPLPEDFRSTLRELAPADFSQAFSDAEALENLKNILKEE